MKRIILSCEISRTTSLYVHVCESRVSFQSSLCKYAFAPDDLQGLACLYPQCRSARPPSMTPYSPGSALRGSKDLGDSYLIIFLSACPPLWVQPAHSVDLNHAHGSLWPFGLSFSYHGDGQAMIRPVRPQDRRRVQSTLLNSHGCITRTLQGSKEVISARCVW